MTGQAEEKTFDVTCELQIQQVGDEFSVGLHAVVLGDGREFVEDHLIYHEVSDTSVITDAWNAMTEKVGVEPGLQQFQVSGLEYDQFVKLEEAWEGMRLTLLGEGKAKADKAKGKSEEHKHQGHSDREDHPGRGKGHDKHH